MKKLLFTILFFANFASFAQSEFIDLDDNDTLRIRLNSIYKGDLTDMFGTPEVSLKVIVQGISGDLISIPPQVLLKTIEVNLIELNTRVNKTYDLNVGDINDRIQLMPFDNEGYILKFILVENDLIGEEATYAMQLVEFSELLDVDELNLEHIVDDQKHILGAPTTYLRADVDIIILRN